MFSSQGVYNFQRNFTIYFQEKRWMISSHNTRFCQFWLNTDSNSWNCFIQWYNSKGVKNRSSHDNCIKSNLHHGSFPSMNSTKSSDQLFFSVFEHLHLPAFISQISLLPCRQRRYNLYRHWNDVVCLRDKLRRMPLIL